MPSSGGADVSAPTQRRVSEEANARVRETAKWLIASYAAVGAALLAGSQLSSIGKLDLSSGRFWVAAAGILVGVAGVAWAIWLAVQILVAQRLSPAAVEREWSNENSAIWKYFSQDPVFFQGFRDFGDRRSQEDKAVLRCNAAEAKLRSSRGRAIRRAKEDVTAAYEALDDIYKRGDAMISLADQIHLASRFRTYVLPRSLVAVVVAAAGIALFSWAANPPPNESVSLRGADLSRADLTGADLARIDLSGADLSFANLTGVDLRGARLRDATLTGVTWSSTTCPDGTNSDAVGGSCENHLVP